MKITERLPKYALDDVRDYVRGNEEDIEEEIIDGVIDDMSNNEIFRAYLEWNGIVGFDDFIKKAVEGIYEVKLKN